MVRLIALKPHTLDGSRRYKTGETYQLSEKSAKLVIAAGLAKLDDGEKQNKPQYRRRDMRAES